MHVKIKIFEEPESICFHLESHFPHFFLIFTKNKKQKGKENMGGWYSLTWILAICIFFYEIDLSYIIKQINFITRF